MMSFERSLCVALSALVMFISGNALAVPFADVRFFADSNTASQFLIFNGSSSGEQISSIQIDVSPTGSEFLPLSPGDPVFAFFPLASGDLSGANITNNNQTLDLTFNDFDLGENFAAIFHLETASSAPLVEAEQLLGAIIRITFSVGARPAALLENSLAPIFPGFNRPSIGTAFASSTLTVFSTSTAVMDPNAVPLPGAMLFFLTAAVGAFQARRLAFRKLRGSSDAIQACFLQPTLALGFS